MRFVESVAVLYASIVTVTAPMCTQWHVRAAERAQQ